MLFANPPTCGACAVRHATAEKSTREPPKDEKKADIVATEGASPTSAGGAHDGKIVEATPSAGGAHDGKIVEATPSAGGAHDGKIVDATPSPPSTAPTDAVSSGEATPLASGAPPMSEAPPMATVQPVAKASTQQMAFISSDELSKIGQAEKTFGALYLEHMFGLLAAILPDSTTVRFTCR